MCSFNIYNITYFAFWYFSFICYILQEVIFVFSAESTGRDFKPPSLSLCFFSLHLALVSCLLGGLFGCMRMAIWVSLETEGDYRPLFSWLGSKGTLEVRGRQRVWEYWFRRPVCSCAWGRNKIVGNTLLFKNNKNSTSFSIWHVIATTCYSLLLFFRLVRGNEASVGTWCFLDMKWVPCIYTLWTKHNFVWIVALWCFTSALRSVCCTYILCCFILFSFV